MASDPLDPLLATRLREIGLDPAAFGDAGEAWRRLQERFGRRASLIDRYALEAAQRGCRPDDLAPEERARLTDEVLHAQYPGIEIVASARRLTSDPVEIVPYRESWPASFAAWRKRLCRALGEVAVRIEHVGSTAVPGLAAKPVIDVQVSVPEIDEESSYAPAIEDIGVALRSREPEHRYFRPAGARPRTVQIHVCAAGGQWERDHLLFRDYLRAHSGVASAYERLKRHLAEHYRGDRLAYNEGKTTFVLDTLASADAWAKSIRWKP